MTVSAKQGNTQNAAAPRIPISPAGQNTPAEMTAGAESAVAPRAANDAASTTGEKAGTPDRTDGRLGQSPVTRGESPVTRGESPVIRGESPVTRGESPVIRTVGRSENALNPC